MAENALRIVWDNLADSSTLSATSVAITAANLLTNSKSEVWRSAATITSCSITATWSTLQSVSCVALPFCNFSPTATMLVKCYSDTAGTNLIYTSATLLCCPSTAIKVQGLTLAQSSSAYAYGGGVAASVYIPVQSARRVTVDIVDTNNLQGYLEATRIVIGAYFSPTYNAEYGASLMMEDMSKNFRSDAGNLHTDVGARYKKLSVSLTALLPVDRAAIWKIVSYCGTGSPVFLSLHPDNDDDNLEQAHIVYGKFTSMSAIASRDYLIYSTPLEVESL